MRWSLLTAISVSPALLFSFAGFGAAQAPDGIRVSAPVTHENLTVYFIHGRSAPGKVPLTLDEAMAKRVVQVRETGNVNELEIENLGDDEVFIQSGDIVKGGRQDRALVVSLVLPPRSGRVPIASFCVEEGRWTARGREDAGRFASAAQGVPSREMKLAMKAPKPVPPAGDPLRSNPSAIAPETLDALRGLPPSPQRSNPNAAAATETAARQREMWEGARSTRARLSGALGADVSSRQSASSLQLALENEKLIEVQRAYIKAFAAVGEAESDIIGYVFAVNGKLNSADVYPSNGLFRKMWAKLLAASATEAIGHKDEPRVEAPPIEAVMAFLAAAERGTESNKPLNDGVSLVTRESEQAYLFETARPASPSSSWVHRNYLAK